MIPRYSMVIRWSEEDQLYLVTFPELTGPDWPQTHGETYAEAAAQGQEVLELLVESFQALGRPLPEPVVVAPARAG